MFVFTTRLPLASIIFANDQPSRLLRTCPRCRGLLVLGDEYSIITRGDWSVAFFSPYVGSALIALSRLTHAFCATTMFKKPFTTLKRSTASQCSCSHWPISCAVSSGFLRDIFRKGNTTSVRLPSNSRLVFCSCTMLSGTSCPYRALTASWAFRLIVCSMFMFLLLFVIVFFLFEGGGRA